MTPPLVALWEQVFYGGVPVAEHKRILKSECPHIIVGTPGRLLQLVREKELLTKGIKHFILDECDKMLEQVSRCPSPSSSFSWNRPSHPPRGMCA